MNSSTTPVKSYPLSSFFPSPTTILNTIPSINFPTLSATSTASCATADSASRCTATPISALLKSSKEATLTRVRRWRVHTFLTRLQYSPYCVKPMPLVRYPK
uniref:Uncharacterized protein n=1 Tax=Opuntia streptacantha TaxID=393608 RepID=A0A7C9EPI1_OPUST